MKKLYKFLYDFLKLIFIYNFILFLSDIELWQTLKKTEVDLKIPCNIKHFVIMKNGLFGEHIDDNL
jgi:hypothetical protein